MQQVDTDIVPPVRVKVNEGEGPTSKVGHGRPVDLFNPLQRPVTFLVETFDTLGRRLKQTYEHLRRGETTRIGCSDQEKVKVTVLAPIRGGSLSLCDARRSEILLGLPDLREAPRELEKPAKSAIADHPPSSFRKSFNRRKF